MLRLIRRHLGMDVGFVSEFRDGRRYFVDVDGEGTPPVAAGDSNPLDESVCHHVAEGRIPQLLTDLMSDPVAAALAQNYPYRVGAHVSIPLADAAGRIFGTACCFSHEPDESIGRRDMAVFRACAEAISAVIRTVRAERQAHDDAEERIRRVLDRRAVRIVYQPIYRLATSELSSFEALARFETEPARPVPEWFADAEIAGLGTELEFLAVEEALKGLSALPPSAALAVNLSPKAITHPSFASLFAGLPVRRIVLEVTEHAVVDSYAPLLAAVDPLRRQGMRLAIDDVGAGHSSFRHVLELRPQLIKLDMSMTRNIHADPARRALLAAIIGFSRKMACEVVAEGIETVEELATIRALGATKVQGYLLSRPLALEAAAAVPLGWPLPSAAGIGGLSPPA